MKKRNYAQIQALLPEIKVILAEGKTQREAAECYGITPSMSTKGNPNDNAMAENFFSILKTERIYRCKPSTFARANEMIGRYIHFYNHKSIQLKTGEVPFLVADEVGGVV